MTGSVNIVRSRPRTKYTKLSNAVANDENLSASALGVLYYILTKPPNWRVIPEQLGTRFGLSYRLVLKVMRELIEVGYVKRELIRDGRWIVGTRYVVTDNPWVFSDEGEVQATIAPDDREITPAEQDHMPENGENRDLPLLHHAERRHTYKRKKDNKTPIPKTLSPAARVTAAGFAGNSKRGKVNKPPPDRGRWEAEVAERIGPNGFDVLWTLPDTEVDHLCARQRCGTLDDQTIARLRLKVPP